MIHLKKSIDIVEKYFEDFSNLLNDDGELIITTPILQKRKNTKYFKKTLKNIW